MSLYSEGSIGGQGSNFFGRADLRLVIVHLKNVKLISQKLEYPRFANKPVVILKLYLKLSKGVFYPSLPGKMLMN
ncbi:MAG TPA: hypothetical protein QF571_10975, partial [Desulfobacterales bacterium]|nr:hypothetical protein [Desulfobacterales bacterium]